MRALWSQLQKDVQLLWPALLLWWLAVALAVATAPTSSTISGALTLLFGVLVAMVVLLEPLAGSDDGWRTRPLPRSILVVAKLVFVLSFLMAPAMIAHWLTHHFLWTHTDVLALLYAFLWLLSLAFLVWLLATMVRGLLYLALLFAATLLSSSFFLFTSSINIVSFLRPGEPEWPMTPTAWPFLLLLGLAAGSLAWRYCSGAGVRPLTIATSFAIAVLLAQVRLHVSPTARFSLEAFDVEPPRLLIPRYDLSLAPAADTRALSSRPVPDRFATIWVQLEIGRLPRFVSEEVHVDSQLFLADGTRVLDPIPDTHRAPSPYDARADALDLESPGKAAKRRWFFRVSIPEEDYRRNRHQLARLGSSITVRLRQTKPLVFAARQGDTRWDGWRSLEVTYLSLSDSAFEIRLTERQLSFCDLRQSLLSNLRPSDLILRHPQRHEILPATEVGADKKLLPNPQTRLRGRPCYLTAQALWKPPPADLAPATKTEAAETSESPRLLWDLPDRAWLAEAELLVFPSENLGEPTSVVKTTFLLDDWVLDGAEASP